MINLSRALYLLILCSVSTCFAEIIKTEDFQVIQETVRTSTKDTLVVFDVDDVILQAKDQIFHTKNKEQLHEYYTKLSQNLSGHEMTYLWSIVDSSRQEKLVDQRILETLAYLKQKQITTIALTHCGTGRFGRIAKIENWRIARLKSAGVDFRILNSLPDCNLPAITTAKWGVPLLKSGVAFTGSTDKGVILKAVLLKAQLKPTKVIFIDDKLKNILSVEKTCREQHMEFVGIQYIAVNSAKIVALNKERTELQFKILEDEQKWLSDQEADQRLSLSAVPQL